MNLNKAIGWDTSNPEIIAILFIRLNQLASDSDAIVIKRSFDEAVLQEFKEKKIGDQAENDKKDETDFHFYCL